MQDDFPAVAAGFPEPFRLLVRDSATSTNDELRTLAEAGAPHGLVMLALRQTHGRGRRGSSWFTSDSGSLAFSILLRPAAPRSFWPRLALAAGLSVAEAIETHVPLVGIKWPNDVIIAGRKVAGILVETGPGFVIVGIGVNVNTAAFPPAVSGIATSISLAAGASVSRPEILASIIRRFAAHSPRIGPGFDTLLDSVRIRCTLTGNPVTLLTPAGPKTGVVEGIGPGGELLLRSPSGLETLLQADKIRLLP